MTTDSAGLPEVEPIPHSSANETAEAATAKPRVAKWETTARDRLRTETHKFAKHLADFMARDANEADTAFLVRDFLCDALGYDKLADLTAEFPVKGEFADYGLRIDKQLVALIEVKRIATKLNKKHLGQVEGYGVHETVEWLVLTNGAQWQVYHLGPTIPVVVDLVIEVDLLGAEPPSRKAERLLPLSHEGMKHGLIDAIWKAKRATSPKAIAKALTSPAVITAVRRELHSETGYLATDPEVLGLVQGVIRGECL